MFVFVTEVVSEFVTFKLHIPVPAPFVGSTQMILFEVREFTVPVRDVEPRIIFTVAPDLKFVPVIVTWVFLLTLPVLGETSVIVGTGPVKVNPFALVTVCPPVVSTTFQSPTAFPVIGREQVIFVVDTQVTLVAVMSACPERVSFTVFVPATKFVPVIVAETDPVFTPELGVILEMVGAGYPTS